MVGTTVEEEEAAATTFEPDWVGVGVGVVMRRLGLDVDVVVTWLKLFIDVAAPVEPASAEAALKTDAIIFDSRLPLLSK